MIKKKSFVVLLAVLSFNCQQKSDESAETRKTDYENISPLQVCQIVKRNPDVVFLDVRSEEEFKGELGHFKNAVQIPVSQLVPQFDKIETYWDKEIIVYCKMGGRSKKACEVLIFNGFEHVKNLDGGLLNWHNASIDTLTCRDELIVYESRN